MPSLLPIRSSDLMNEKEQKRSVGLRLGTLATDQPEDLFLWFLFSSFIEGDRLLSMEGELGVPFFARDELVDASFVSVHQIGRTHQFRQHRGLSRPNTWIRGVRLVIDLAWLTKVWKTVPVLVGILLLLGLCIGIVTAFSLPEWAWTISKRTVCFIAVYVFIPACRRFVGCLIRPAAYSGVCLLAVSGMSLLAGVLAVFSFVSSFSSFPSVGIVSFFCIGIGFLAFFLMESSLSQCLPQWRHQKGPLDDDGALVGSHPPGEPLVGNHHVFICCDVEDEKLTQPLRDHLRLLEEQGLIDVWDQTKIPPGMMMQDEIERAIEAAGVAIILISTNLLKSDYIMEYQLPTLLHNAEARGTRVIPVKARACFYEGTGLEQFRPHLLPGKREKTLEEMSGWERNEYLSSLAGIIYQQLGVTKRDSQEGGAHGSKGEFVQSGILASLF